MTEKASDYNCYLVLLSHRDFSYRVSRTLIPETWVPSRFGLGNCDRKVTDCKQLLRLLQNSEHCHPRLGRDLVLSAEQWHTPYVHAECQLSKELYRGP